MVLRGVFYGDLEMTLILVSWVFFKVNFVFLNGNTYFCRWQSIEREILSTYEYVSKILIQFDLEKIFTDF